MPKINMPKILVTNIGFGKASPTAINRLGDVAELQLNDRGLRHEESAMAELIHDATILIAGTEKISKKVLDKAPNLKMIARVGVGVDNIDLNVAQTKKINISYTPDAPSQAIPEFTLSLILALIKGIPFVDRMMHQKIWQRPMGRMLSSLSIGIVGAGRIGSKLIHLINTVSPQTKIFFYDPFVSTHDKAQKLDLGTLFKECDIISLHLPYTDDTRNLIDRGLLFSMKENSYLINTARGGLVDEQALYELLHSKQIAGAALDVFEQEPYTGPLCDLDNCLLTSHIGSLTQEIRAIMEEQVVEDVVRFINQKPLLNPLPGFNFCEI